MASNEHYTEILIMASILIVDDDLEVLDLLNQVLTKEHYQVTTATDGEKMDKALENHTFDVVLLDIMLPGRDGLELCKTIRQSHPNIAIIMISAKGEDIDRIIGLEIGADDYLPKPFNSRELVARIKAIMRRNNSSNDNEEIRGIHFGHYYLDPEKLVVNNTLTNEVITLTSGEFSLLHTLAKNMGKPISRERLLNETQGRDATPYDRSIDVMIGRLRQKLEETPQKPRLLKTIRNQGYVLIKNI